MPSEVAQYHANYLTADDGEIDIFNQENGIVLDSSGSLTIDEVDQVITHLARAKARWIEADRIRRNNGVTPEQVLDLPMDPAENDADAVSVRDYLSKLTMLVWQYTEGFDGKRPFGNSGWCSELYPPLVKAGLIDDEDDERGYDLIKLAISGFAKTTEPAAAVPPRRRERVGDVTLHPLTKEEFGRPYPGVPFPIDVTEHQEGECTSEFALTIDAWGHVDPGGMRAAARAYLAQRDDAGRIDRMIGNVCHGYAVLEHRIFMEGQDDGDGWSVRRVAGPEGEHVFPCTSVRCS